LEAAYFPEGKNLYTGAMGGVWYQHKISIFTYSEKVLQVKSIFLGKQFPVQA
jgi:hypothetical protein